MKAIPPSACHAGLRGGGSYRQRENAKGKREKNKRMGKSENGKMKEDKRNNITYIV